MLITATTLYPNCVVVVVVVVFASCLFLLPQYLSETHENRPLEQVVKTLPEGTVVRALEGTFTKMRTRLRCSVATSSAASSSAAAAASVSVIGTLGIQRRRHRHLKWLIL